ncbi:MFS transporter [Streptomyces sp. FH025]|uniref:MFS transporter n=1 Tax=Streptomyces sp. FH025 TaxID=2815937 RepID=UPI001A9FD2DA|nr:MFS transporter [Streptomyces sp. FH025]MBO1416763.1 MFS transporter [Streptomyces sp. FH025]
MSSPNPSYAAVLRAPHAARTFGAALLGRLSYGMVPLAMMLAVRDATGSYPVAGTVLALFGLTSVFLSPARAALVDRYGPRRALAPMAALYAALLTLVAGVTWRPGAPPVLTGALVVAAGACTPPLGPVMRTLWRRLLPDQALLGRAYSLDTVAEELLFVSGPLLVGLLLALAGPAAGVAAGAGLVLAGTLALVASPAARQADRSGPAAPGERPHGGGELRRAVLASAATGLALGALDLMVVAFAEERGRAGALAWILAALSAGSAVGGLAYGAVGWSAPNRARLPLLVAGLGLALAGAGLAPNLPVLAAAVALAGLFVSPVITTAYLIADETAAPRARTRAGAWVNTAFNAGSAGGSATVGLLVGRLPLPLCFALAAAPALLCAASTAHRLRDFGGDRSLRKSDTGADLPL